MKIGIACDHAAFDEKLELIDFLKNKGFQVLDFGCNSKDSVDYPDYAHILSNKIITNEVEKGILICGTGIGISIAANRNKGIRAALCCNEYHAEMSRKHNNANIIAFGARITSLKDMFRMTDIFLNTDFEGGRHEDRIKKIESNE